MQLATVRQGAVETPNNVLVAKSRQSANRTNSSYTIYTITSAAKYQEDM